MDFIDRINELSARIPNILEKILTEEATKAALVTPFIEALGYSVSDPTDVTPEYHADQGTKKGEKVDYALLIDGKPVILIECKHHSTDLKSLDQIYYTQLFRYFTATKAKFGILTNGILFRFFTDLDERNLMDKNPFFEFDMRDINPLAVEELKKFSKSAIDLNSMTDTALELKHKKETKEVISNQLNNPDIELVRFVASKVFLGSKNFRKITEFWVIKFTEYTKWALNEVIKDKLTQSLNTALASRIEPASGSPSDTGIEIVSPSNQTDAMSSTIASDELKMNQWAIYHIIRTILREVIDPKRISKRNAKTYFGILLDDNNRKPICHLHFNDAQWDVVFFDTKEQERVLLQDLDDLYKYAERLKAFVALYKPKTGAQG